MIEIKQKTKNYQAKRHKKKIKQIYPRKNQDKSTQENNIYFFSRIQFMNDDRKMKD